MLRLKLSLKGAKPPVTRTISLPADATMADLSNSIRYAFGWSFMHLHTFYTSIGEITNSDLGDNPKESDEENIKVVDLRGCDIDYVYDFGDCWHVSVRFLKDVPNDAKNVYKEVGENPPEDCGGVYAFNEIRRDPDLRAEWGMDPIDDE